MHIKTALQLTQFLLLAGEKNNILYLLTVCKLHYIVYNHIYNLSLCYCLYCCWIPGSSFRTNRLSVQSTLSNLIIILGECNASTVECNNNTPVEMDVPVMGQSATVILQ